MNAKFDAAAKAVAKFEDACDTFDAVRLNYHAVGEATYDDVQAARAERARTGDALNRIWETFTVAEQDEYDAHML